MLGILGNRGIEREKVFDTLMLYVHGPDGSTRAAAVNGLGLLGTENTIAPLLDVFRCGKKPCPSWSVSARTRTWMR